MVKITSQIEVGLNPVRVVYSKAERGSLVIANTSDTATLYYGADNQVTTANGIPILPKTNVGFLRGLGDRPDLERWLVSDTPGVDVRIGEEDLEEGEGL